MTRGPRPPLALALPAIAGALLLLAQPATAQQEPAKGESLERAQKAADAVFHWIKLNADKGANRPAAPAPAPAPAPAAVAKKAAPAPAPVAAAPKPAPAPAAAPTTTTAAAPTPAPAPAVTTAAAPAAPEPAVAAAALPEPAAERTPVVLASAAPSPAPAAPMAAAAKAVEPPPPPQEEAEEPLKLLSKVNPTLPRQMQQGNFRNGFAQVQFTVGPDGAVQQASVIKATHSRLGTAAVEAVKQWRFAPLRKAREAAVEVAFSNDGE